MLCNCGEICRSFHWMIRFILIPVWILYLRACAIPSSSLSILIPRTAATSIHRKIASRGFNSFPKLWTTLHPWPKVLCSLPNAVTKHFRSCVSQNNRIGKQDDWHWVQNIALLCWFREQCLACLWSGYVRYNCQHTSPIYYCYKYSKLQASLITIEALQLCLCSLWSPYGTKLPQNPIRYPWSGNLGSFH